MLCSTLERIDYGLPMWDQHEEARFVLNVGDRHLVLGARVTVAQNQNRPPYERHNRSNKRVNHNTYHISAVHR